jgi:hypothetical protein
MNSVFRHAPDRAPRSTSCEVPPALAVDRAEDRILDRCRELHDFRSEVPTLSARCVVALHDPLIGSATATSGQRSPGYRRQQLRGEHPITLEDLAQLATEPTRECHTALAAVLRILADEIGYDLAPRGRAIGTLASTTGALTKHIGVTADVVLMATADGVVTADELVEIRVAAQRLRQLAADLDAVVGAAR